MDTDTTKSKTIFMKASGDLVLHPDFIEAITKQSQENHVVVCVGGGGQINRTFAELGTGEDKERHGPLGRELKTLTQKNIAKEVLENHKTQLEAVLQAGNIDATVLIPVLDIDGIMCHINGDQMVRAVYIGFDELYVFTTDERLEKKNLEFDDLPKVRVIGLEKI